MARNHRSRSASAIRYVPCQVEPGMFRGEWLVFVDVLDPQNPDKMARAQLLVDHREVVALSGQPGRNNPARAWLRVALTGKAKNVAQLVLPQPASPGGENVLMKLDQVKPEPGT